jgi:hypothetical protein
VVCNRFVSWEFPEYFADFCSFERTSFVLRFGDFVTVERVDIALGKF